jgi:acyl-coenzyme A thioesterase PaaI-like protein
VGRCPGPPSWRSPISRYTWPSSPRSPVALAVTTSLSFNFLRKPAQRDLIAECRLLKLGKRLAVGEILIRSDGETEIACHATGTYSIPDRS